MGAVIEHRKVQDELDKGGFHISADSCGNVLMKIPCMGIGMLLPARLAAAVGVGLCKAAKRSVRTRPSVGSGMAG